MEQQQDVDFTDPTLTCGYILYVHNNCEHSKEIRYYVRNNLRDEVYIQDINNIPREELMKTSWLDGVPVIVEKKSGSAFKGSNAFSFVENIPKKPSLKTR